MIHVVAYDLVTPNDTAENYEIIIRAIKSLFNSWCHIEQSVWLIDTPHNAASVRQTLKDYLHSGLGILELWGSAQHLAQGPHVLASVIRAPSSRIADIRLQLRLVVCPSKIR
jgi:hypothetical protein